MTTKQLEKALVREFKDCLKEFHSKTENLISEVVGSKVVSKEQPKSKAKIQVRRSKSGEPNRSELIRAYFNKHGLDSRPRDVIESLKKEGITVAPALVSIVKNKLNGGSKVVKTEVKKDAKKTGKPLPSVVQSVLEKNKDGLKLSDLTNKVKEAGYQYHGKKGDEGLKQNVFQCLYSLSKEKHHPGFEGTDPVVYKDENKRYVLNPKARRSA